MTGTVFVFSRILKDGGPSRQTVTVYAPTEDAAKAIVERYLSGLRSTAGGSGPAYKLDPPFHVQTINLDSPKLLLSVLTT